MSEQPSAGPFQLTEREHRWLTALLILGTVAVAFVVVYFVTSLIAYFNDVIMIFFLAWLLAFILSPLANGLLHLFPRLPRAIAVIIVYSLLIVVVLAALIVVAQQLYGSVSTLVSNWPTPDQLTTILAPWQQRLDSIGLSQIHLADQMTNALINLKNGADALVQPLGDIAFASLGIMGNLLFVFFLSLYMSVDRERIVSFLFRLVPPAYKDEAKLLEHSISRSFGGFLRGQALIGLMYGAVSMAASLLLGLPYMPVTAVSSGVLQAIPFFGPFISWMPPVLVAIFFVPDAVLPVLIIMVVGWFVLMNAIQPRLMAEAVGLHPVVVLGSVMIGTKLAGIPGAIFGIPVAAVVAAFFFYYLGHMRVDAQPVAVRAARRIEEREGRPVRVPRLPQAGEDQEVEPGSAAAPQPMARKQVRAPKPETPAPTPEA
ncbi:MAG: AI-2E family transporter [Candidatus Limnocylindrales bacterium]|jgi:predicted PurR-regulated permease PerM